jgi:type VI secretion system protein ImpE
MDARERLRASDLGGALEQLKQEVRKTPRDARLRTFLFQLFCLFGEWDRAVTQLTAAAELDPLALPMAQTYRAAIRCEMLRARVFAGERTPTVFGQPEAWMSLLIEANRALASGRGDEAAKLRDTAFEQAPTANGTIDGEAFEWLADADPRLGPMLEAMIDGKYYWVPFHRIRTLDIEAPEDLRDQVWMPAHFVWENSGESFGFIPTRYPGSHAASDQAIVQARRTEWQDRGSGWFLGLGQRMLATDTGEHAVMDIRQISMADQPAAVA